MNSIQLHVPKSVAVVRIELWSFIFTLFCFKAFFVCWSLSNIVLKTCRNFDRHWNMKKSRQFTDPFHFVECISPSSLTFLSFLFGSTFFCWISRKSCFCYQFLLFSLGQNTYSHARFSVMHIITYKVLKT